jgi:16S rRNA (cytosine967-C5)-methyltransferase
MFPERIPLSETLLAGAKAVQQVLAGRSLSDALTAAPASIRASAQAVSFHAMRQLGLARELSRLMVTRPPKEPLLDALLLVSLTLLETAIDATAAPSGSVNGTSESGAASEAASARPDRGLPVYAVHTLVDQAVTAAAGNRRTRAGKNLLNACLRRYLRERQELLDQARKNPQALYNHPQWWIDQVHAAYPGQWQALLAAANVPGPMMLRVNRRKVHVPQVRQAFVDAGFPARAVGADALLLQTPRPVTDLPGFAQGWWSVQDFSAQQAAMLLPLHDGMRVLDACAAPGGKTAHMLERAQLNMVALDSDPARLARVDQNLKRLGLAGPNVTLLCANAADTSGWWDGVPFDAILADVPCTASGVVRRHPDIRWLRRPEDVGNTAALQRSIVDALWPALKPGGHMLYATCSIFPQEGEEQAQAFSRRHPDAIRLPAPGQLLPLPEPGLPAADGFFYALFVKRPGVNENDGI